MAFVKKNFFAIIVIRFTNDGTCEEITPFVDEMKLTLFDWGNVQSNPSKNPDIAPFLPSSFISIHIQSVLPLSPFPLQRFHFLFLNVYVNLIPPISSPFPLFFP
jgi:hypothetical protein